MTTWRSALLGRVVSLGRWLMWWRPKPGFVRVSSKELIRLLTESLRAERLEASIVAARAQHLELERNSRGLALLAQQQAAAQVRLDSIEIDLLMRDLPRADAGHLHEPAFLAMIGSALLERRLFANIPTSGGLE